MTDKNQGTDAEASRIALLVVAHLIADDANAKEKDDATREALSHTVEQAYREEYEKAGGSFHQGWSVDLDAALDMAGNWPAEVQAWEVVANILEWPWQESIDKVKDPHHEKQVDADPSRT